MDKSEVLDMLDTYEEQIAQRSRYWGMYYGLVEDNQDPLKLGRLKVRCPIYHDGVTMRTEDIPWANYVAPYGGEQDVGFYFIPRVGSQVVIAFNDGHPWYPMWMGTVWGQPEGVSETLVAGQVLPDPDWDFTKYSSISTPYGHLIELDDNVINGIKFTRINIKTPDNYFIQLSEQNRNLEINTQDSRNMIFDDANETIRITTPDTHTFEMSSVGDFIEIRTEGSSVMRFDDPNQFISITTNLGWEMLFDEASSTIDIKGELNDHYFRLTEEDLFSPEIGIYNRRASNIDSFVRIRRSIFGGDNIELTSNANNSGFGNPTGQAIILDRGFLPSRPGQILLTTDGYSAGATGMIRLITESAPGDNIFPVGRIDIIGPGGRILILNEEMNFWSGDSGGSDLTMNATDLVIRGGPTRWVSRYFTHTHDMLFTGDPAGPFVMVSGSPVFVQGPWQTLPVTTAT